MKYKGRKIPVQVTSIWILMGSLLFCKSFFGQNYHAINGSSYAGSLGSANNPASIVHVPYAWDITPFSGQVKQSTNAFTIQNYSFFSLPKNVEMEMVNGIKDRFVFATQDLRLLNTRISLHSRAAIAFGANFRSYSYGLSSRSNYQDTMYSLADFMKENTDHLPLSGEFTGSSWGELYGSYAQTILDFGDKLLNAGVTLKYTRGLGGGYGRMEDVAYTTSNDENRPGYLLTRGNLQYAYSHNFDLVDGNKSTAANRKAFLENTYSSFGVDFGFEYIMLSDDENSSEAGYAYDTKIGLSIMDIGSDSYQRGSRSRMAIAGLPGITDTLIEDKISPVLSFDEFNDSLETISESFRVLTGRFTVYRPTRLTINLDQHIYNNFFLNADLTVPLIPLAGENSLYVKELNLLAITPRWEVQSMGAYLPVLYNTRQQLWVGAAVKMGPVLFGTHNLPGLFSKDKTQTGGVYLAFTIRPGGTYNKDANAPGPKLSRKEKRSLECTKF